MANVTTKEQQQHITTWSRRSGREKIQSSHSFVRSCGKDCRVCCHNRFRHLEISQFTTIALNCLNGAAAATVAAVVGSSSLGLCGEMEEEEH